VVLAHLVRVVTATATKESPTDATVTMTNPAKRVRGDYQEFRVRGGMVSWKGSPLIGSVQRMGDYAALADRSFWLACG
jgi:hypothetical protein